MVGDLDMQVSDMIEAMENIQITLNKLTELYPESLLYDYGQVKAA